jgi:AbrB family looped-hinge helix DNA binding protein
MWHDGHAMEITLDRFGRIVIPKSLRDGLGLGPGAVLEIEEKNDDSLLLRARRPDPAKQNRQGRLLAQEAFAALSARVGTSRAEKISPLFEAFVRAVDGYDVAGAPKLRLTEADDGALLVEWTLPDRRLGFSIEEKPEESGWYFVLSNDASGLYEAGTMDQLEMERLVSLMVSR